MDQSPTKPVPTKAKGSAGAGRDDRLKAALKANMARRKAQAKAKAMAAAGSDQGAAGNEQQQGE